MYKAMQIYPFSSNTKGERIILTEGSVSKVKSFWLWAEYSGVNTYFLAEQLNMLPERVQEVRNNPNNYVPSLNLYLIMMDLSGIPITHRDLNYSYANVIYSPDEIKARMLRLNLPDRFSRVNNSGYGYIAQKLGLYPKAVWNALTYGRWRDARVYGMAMRWISDREQAYGYSDAMRFEA